MAKTRKRTPKRRRIRKIIDLEGLDIQLRPFKPLGFVPEAVVVGISAEGTVGPLAVSQLIQQLGMTQVCGLESPLFPPISMVYFRKPKFPARIYASKKHRLAVLLAEFSPADELARPLAYAIMHWSDANEAQRIIAIDSFPAGLSAPAGVPAAAVGATARDRRLLAKVNLSEVQHGAVTGVAAILLNEGRWQDRDAIAILAAAGGSDAQSAAAALGQLQKILPRLAKVAPTAKATQLEKAIETARRRVLPGDFI